MAPIHEAKRFTIYFYGSIVVVVWLAVVASNGELALPSWSVAFRGLTSGALVAYLFSVSMDKWLWRAPFLQKLFGIPDLSGRWEGWYWNTMGQVWLPNAHEIAQNSWRVSFHSWGPKNESTTVFATLLSDGHGKIELASIYTTKAISGTAEAHMGASNLSLSRTANEVRLLGTYWTNGKRDDGTQGKYGYIRLVKARKEKQNMTGLSFIETDWAMSMPGEAPEPLRAQ